MNTRVYTYKQSDQHFGNTLVASLSVYLSVSKCA